MDAFERSRQALAMLEAFGLVGVTRCSLTLTDHKGTKTDYRSDCDMGILREYISVILEKSARSRKNVILRPKPPQYTLLQLDDLAEEAIERVKPFSFLAFRTSPGSHQAWLAIGDGNADFSRRVKLGIGADPSASGATRVCGSVNFKPTYAPDYPIVTLIHTACGRIVQRADLLDADLVAEAEQAHVPPRHASRQTGTRQRFPAYSECLRHAPRRKDGQADRSKADFFFAYLAAKWGWSAEAIAAELLRVSTKAAEKGAGYALLTAQHAAENARKHGGGA